MAVVACAYDCHGLFSAQNRGRLNGCKRSGRTLKCSSASLHTLLPRCCSGKRFCLLTTQALSRHHGLRKSMFLDGVGRHCTLCEGFDSAVHVYGLPGINRGRADKLLNLVVNAVFERFTERAIKSVMLAQREAKALGMSEVGTEQLLLGLIAEDRASEGFLRSGVTIERAKQVARLLSGNESTQTGHDKPATEVPFSLGSKRVFEAALENSKTMGHNYIAPEHIALALFTVDEGPAIKILERLGLKIEKLRAEAISRLQGELYKEGRMQVSSLAVSAKPSTAAGSVSNRAASRKEAGALADFCVDITAQAREGKIDPVIGREKEVQRVLQILARRTKNNPILLGEPGVGKTAIAEGLALRIVDSTVPEFLSGNRVMALDLGLLLAGAKERGELEARVTGLIDEIKKAGDVVLLIDEVHMLVGSGTSGRGGINAAGLDIANLLKPALARGELQCIGATTMVEHRRYIEKDKALARRFQPVLIDEPSQEDAVRILLGLRQKYEEHHKCRITAEAIEAAVYLSSRYIADRFLPDKAIDLLDEAGSQARIKACKRRKEREVSILSRSPSEYWQEIRAVQAYQEAVLVPQKENTNLPDDFLEMGIPASSQSNVALPGSDNYDKATLNVSSLFSNNNDDSWVVVGPAEIASVASLWSGVPVEQLTADEQSKLVHLEETLKNRVVGQNDAVCTIARAVKRARAGLKDPNRPIAAMLFCGPTGVGKTELTKALAKHYFGSEMAMIRLDMSEYMERHTVSKLIGSPPGYIGYGEGGALTEAVRRRPFTIILLDEIEKAHPDVFNILLQVFEDGHLTDSQGRKVSFKNTLLVMTSNIGSTAIARGGSNRIGFTFSEDLDGGKYAALKQLVMDELRSYFRPELLNRLDEVVVFRSLEKADVREIVETMLRDTKARLLKLGIGLEISEGMIKRICEQGYDSTYGARPLRRAITQLVEDSLSEAILADDYIPGDTALVDVDESGHPFVIHHHKPDRCHHGLCISVYTSTT